MPPKLRRRPAAASPCTCASTATTEQSTKKQKLIQDKKVQVTKLSGRTVPLDLIDIVTVGGGRLAAAQACNMFPGRARLISSLGIIAQDDAATIQTLGDVATIVLTDDSWDLT